MPVVIAGDFLDHIRAGLVMNTLGDGKWDWWGSENNWKVYRWIRDGVYDDYPVDMQSKLINEFLTQ